MPTTSAPTRAAAGLSPEPRRFRLVAAVVAGLTMLFFTGWFGWWLNTATHPAQQVRVEQTFSGVVTAVGNDGHSGCVRPDHGASVCSIFLLEPGTTARVGESVRVAHVQIAQSSNLSSDALLIYPPD